MEFESTIITPYKLSLRSRIALRLRGTYNFDTRFWRLSLSGVWAVGCYMFALTALSIPTGLGTMLDIAMMITLGTLGLFGSAHLIAFLLALIGIPCPRLFIGGIIFNLVTFYFMFWIPGSGIVISIFTSVILTMIGMLIGCWIAIITNPYTKMMTKWMMTIFISTIPIVIVGPMFIDKSDIVRVSPIVDTTIENIPLPSPAELGLFDIQHFTYGSGTDKYREEYGASVNLQSASVDASSYIDTWPWLRTLSWGFDEKSLPLNARTWMPTGEGPFPLVLMVHGNHLMEDHSDGGYDYLGELLASRGFIAISVDENFLNYSVWSNIPDNDIKIRTWILLKHLQQVKRFSEQAESPFYKNVDLQRVALIGHSRGGQAAAMAADADRWFRSDLDLAKDLKEISIQAVVALAPTDALVDGVHAKLRNVSYMVLQGARDADVNDYFGERQYDRVQFSTHEIGFKTYLHIPNANHAQFNTSWGGLDTGLPKGLFLNRNNLMKGSEQREVAKVYISAFLETTLHGQKAYTDLFRDYRTGLQWLPDSIYFNRFEDSHFLELATFDEDKVSSNVVDKIKTEVSGELRATEESITPENKGILLSWNNDDSQAASYSFTWDHDDKSNSYADADGFSFSLADQSIINNSEHPNPLPITKVDITIETKDDISITLPLVQFMNVQPMINPQFTKNKWLESHFDDEKYANMDDGIFQTVLLPFEDLEKVNVDFVPNDITRMTLIFNEGPGEIVFSDFGLYWN
ncbi:alpha/beta hydrolase family protein [Paenibacillus sp. CMAA1364]